MLLERLVHREALPPIDADGAYASGGAIDATRDPPFPKNKH